MFLLLTLAQTRKAEVRLFKNRHPLLVTAAVFTAGYYFVYQIGCVAVFGMGVVVPVLASVIHATLR
jgi:ABC-type proline/glycine betaine transport system permease subunit